MARLERGLQKSNRYCSGKGKRLTRRGGRAYAPGRVYGPKTGSHLDVVVGVKNALQSSHLSVDEPTVKGVMEELRPVRFPSALLVQHPSGLLLILLKELYPYSNCQICYLAKYSIRVRSTLFFNKIIYRDPVFGLPTRHFQAKQPGDDRAMRLL